MAGFHRAGCCRPCASGDVCLSVCNGPVPPMPERNAADVCSQGGVNFFLCPDTPATLCWEIDVAVLVYDRSIERELYFCEWAERGEVTLREFPFCGVPINAGQMFNAEVPFVGSPPLVRRYNAAGGWQMDLVNLRRNVIVQLHGNAAPAAAFTAQVQHSLRATEVQTGNDNTLLGDFHGRIQRNSDGSHAAHAVYGVPLAPFSQYFSGVAPLGVVCGAPTPYVADSGDLPAPPLPQPGGGSIEVHSTGINRIRLAATGLYTCPTLPGIQLIGAGDCGCGCGGGCAGKKTTTHNH